MTVTGAPSKRDVRTEFDAKAGTYEDDRLGAWYRSQDRWALEHLGDVEGPVLDVGCGTGWLLRRWPETQGMA